MSFSIYSISHYCPASLQIPFLFNLWHPEDCVSFKEQHKTMTIHLCKSPPTQGFSFNKHPLIKEVFLLEMRILAVTLNCYKSLRSSNNKYYGVSHKNTNLLLTHSQSSCTIHSTEVIMSFLNVWNIYIIIRAFPTH